MAAKLTSGRPKFSYFSGGNALAVRFAGKTIKSIRPLGGGTEMGTARSSRS